MARRPVLLCVVALFAAVTLQPAIAQDDSSHKVTIEVDPVQKLTIDNDIGPVTASELNSEFADVPDTDKSETETFEVRTNVSSGQKVVAEAMEGKSEGQTGELGLQVTLTGMNGELDGGETVFGYQTLLLPTSTDPGAKKVAGGIGQTKSSGTLTYRAKATPKFNPSDDATVYIEYTIQEE